MSNNKDNLSVSMFSKICRTCLAEGELKSLNEKCNEDDCLIEMVMTVTFVQLSEKDGLPFQICSDCEKEIVRSFNFAQKCLEVEDKLQNCYKEFQNKIRNLYSFKTIQDNDAQIQLETKIDIEETSNHLKIIEEISEFTQIEHNYSENPNNINKKVTQNDQRNDEILSQTEICVSVNKMSDTKQTKVSVNDSKLKKRPQRIRYPKIKLKPGESYECKKCFEKFTTSKLLWVHWREAKHPPGKWGRKTCNICSKSVRHSTFDAHMRVHTKEKPYVCEFCAKRFSLNSNLNRHLKIHSGNKPHKCDYCHKSFIQSTTLKNHLRIHTGEMPFICDYCGKAFKSSGILKMHLNSHEEGSLDTSTFPQHECDICHKKYHQKSVLAQHKLIHGDKKFLCSICGRGFIRRANLDSHINTHTGVKPFPCETCGKSFQQIGILNSHILTHTGAKPHVCQICHRGFTQGQHMRYHMRTHTGEKPYSCVICDKSFPVNTSLKIHMRTHTGEQPYLCPVCGKGFYDSSSMHKHRKKVHGNEAV